MMKTDSFKNKMCLIAVFLSFCGLLQSGSGR